VPIGLNHTYFADSKTSGVTEYDGWFAPTHHMFQRKKIDLLKRKCPKRAATK